MIQRQRLVTELRDVVSHAIANDVSPDVLELIATSIYGLPSPISEGPTATQVAEENLEAVLRAVEVALRQRLSQGN